VPANLVPVKSSNVDAVGYDAATKELHVRFKGNPKVYIHDGVTPQQHAAFLASPSKGKFYAANFKGKQRK
jgi:hypothetical protein